MNTSMTKNTKLDALKEILYGAGISFILGMIGYVLMFFFKLITARHFGPEGYGIYEMLYTILGVVMALSGLGLGQGIMRYIPEYLEKKEWHLIKGYKNFTSIVTLISSGVFATILFLSANTITNFFNYPQEFALFIRIISISVPLKMLADMMAYYLLAYKKPLKAGLGHNIIERIVLVLGIVIIALLDLSIMWLVISLAIALIINFLITIIFYLQLKTTTREKKYDVKDWIKFSYPLMFVGLLTYILQWTDNLVIGKYLTPVELGLYGASYSLASYVLFIPSIFATLFLPVMMQLYHKDKKSFDETYKQVIKWTLATTLFIGAIFIIFSQNILFAIFGEEFIGANISFMILTTFFVITTIYSFSHIMMMIEKDTTFFLKNTIIFAVINFVLNIILIQQLGIMGVAIASGLSLLMLRLSEYIKSRKHRKIKDKKQIATYIKIIITAGISTLLVKGLFYFILNHVQINEYIKLGIALAIYTASYGLMILKLKILNKEDLDLMYALEQKLGLNLNWLKKLINNFL